MMDFDYMGIAAVFYIKKRTGMMNTSRRKMLDHEKIRVEFESLFRYSYTP